MTYRLNPPSYFLVNEVCECGIINSMTKVVLVPTLILVIFLARGMTPLTSRVLTNRVEIG